MPIGGLFGANGRAAHDVRWGAVIARYSPDDLPLKLRSSGA